MITGCILESSEMAVNRALAAEAKPAGLKIAGSVAGDSGSAKAMKRLAAQLAALRIEAAVPMLREAVNCLRRNDPASAADWAVRALDNNEQFGMAWYVLAIAREREADYAASVACYEKALALLPDDPELPHDLGRLALRLGMLEVAEKLFNKYLVLNPASADGINNLAGVLRDQMRFGEAVELIRPLLYAEPHHAMLWNTLGTILTEQGDVDQSLVFYGEALRLDPAFIKARYNRANALQQLGRTPEAIEEVEIAMRGDSAPDEAAMIALAHALMLVSSGDLQRGWEAYEARLSPQYADSTDFLANRPRWTPDAELNGRSLLVMGEQGLGDEVMFATVLPEVLEALGPDGRLTLGIERRLVPLFQRSFPQVRVEPHGTYKVGHRSVRALMQLEEWDGIDLWTPVASLLRGFRSSLDSFPDRKAFLKRDEAAASGWRERLDAVAPGPKVGILWKSLRIDASRARYFSPFEQWRPVLTTPGVTFVNLQYGECQAELDQAERELGVRIVQPEGINLKDDLTDLADLTGALDLIIGPANATTNIAGACGAPVWQVSTPGSWPRLGTDRYPWYPNTRVFVATAYNDWEPVMQAIAAELRERFSS